MTGQHPREDLFFSHALLPDGWARNVAIDIDGGRIARVAVGAGPDATRGSHDIALPGLPNLHSHAFQRGMAGLAERRGTGDDSFWTWRETMYRFVDRIDPDQLRAIAAFAYVEMLETGFTRVGEFHYLHHDRGGAAYADPAAMTEAIVAAAQDSRIALTHLPVFYAHGGFGETAPGAAQRRFVHDIDGFAHLLDGARTMLATLPDAVLGIAPHSLRAVTADELLALEALAGHAPIHIHIAEQVREVDDCVAWSGARPVRWLFDHAPVDARWCLVHATHVDAHELAAIVAGAAVVGLCPITEANLGDGIFPAAEFLRAGGRFGIGSDSNVRIDLTGELRLLEYGQRLTLRARNVLASDRQPSTGQTIFDAAVAGGGQALGVEGGIAVGRPADIVSLKATDPSLIGREGGTILDSLIFASGRDAIDRVWRFGREVVVDGRHVDRDAIAARYRRVLATLLAD